MTDFEKKLVSFLLEYNFYKRTTPVSLELLTNVVTKELASLASGSPEPLDSSLSFFLRYLDFQSIMEEVNKGIADLTYSPY